MDDADKRTHTRAQYFLIKDADQVVPIYAFRDPADSLGIPALVVDLGDGGVQVLSNHTAELSHQVYNLELVVGNAVEVESNPAQVHKVWSRADGVNTRTGFAFAQDCNAGVVWTKILHGAPHNILRCVLHPVR
jgi:hypothetical protein